jgi:hypothetical protein
LKNYLYPILLQYGGGRPALVFCASRREAEDSAAKARKLRCTFALLRFCFSQSVLICVFFSLFPLAQVVEGIPRGAGHTGGPAHPFVRSAAAASALASAAASAESPRLAACLPAGVAFHSAALSSSDRSLVESLFREGALLVLCTTSTLAQGVNLPARLVVVKGTRQYDKGGYREYPRAAILQMIGRAGRPQFDERGLGVIMTERHRVSAYTALAGGGEAVESRLAGALAEHVAAEVVAGTVSDISQAVTWLQASFLCARMRAAPAAYGLPHGAQGGAMEREMKALLLRTCAALADAGCIKARRASMRLRLHEHADDATPFLLLLRATQIEDDGFGLLPLPPGIEMTRYYVVRCPCARVRIDAASPCDAIVAPLNLCPSRLCAPPSAALRHAARGAGCAAPRGAAGRAAAAGERGGVWVGEAAARRKSAHEGAALRWRHMHTHTHAHTRTQTRVKDVCAVLCWWADGIAACVCGLLACVCRR